MEQDNDAKKDQLKAQELVKQQLQAELKSAQQGAISTASIERASLLEQIKDKDEIVIRLKLEIESLRNTNKDYEQTIVNLKERIAALNADVERYKGLLAVAKAQAPVGVNPSAVLSQELDRHKKELTLKESELRVVRKQMDATRDELETKKCELTKLGSEKRQNVELLETTLGDLQRELSKERLQSNTYAKQHEEDKRSIQDMSRQVKEMERIMRRKNPDSIAALIMAANSEADSGRTTARITFLESRIQQLELELLAKESSVQNNVQEVQAQLRTVTLKYEEHIADLQAQIAIHKQEIKEAVDEASLPNVAEPLKSSVDKDKDKEKDKGKGRVKAPPAAPVPALAQAARQDAHLLATIRGLKMELAARDKDLQRINREIDELRKTNRTLQKERERLIQRRASVRSVPNEDVSSAAGERKPYDPSKFEAPSEQQETIEKLEEENKALKRDLLHLEEEFRNLRTKWLQDISALQSQHDQEMSRLLSEHVARISGSQLVDLQGQLSTQQLVISHLKEQLSQLGECREEIVILKTERDHLEKTVMELNKKLAALKNMQTPEAVQFETLHEKIALLEQRHETREQRLQAMVRDLLRSSSQQSSSEESTASLQERLLDKNRQLCLYQSEMDRILEALREFHRQKSAT